MGKGQALYRSARKIIPGGTQLLTKRPEMLLPEYWPVYYDKAKGCNVWDLDGNKYMDMSYMGIGSCILGYADGDVDKAVKAVIDRGSMSTLNAPEEVELAKLLIEMHPWADMARYARSGGEAMSIAVRIARAFSRKDIVLFCGYHGWHDWYLAANLASDKALDGHLLPGLNPLGVPRGLRGTAYPFQYNDVEGFTMLVKKYKAQLGAIVIESIRNIYPKDGFVRVVNDAAKKLQIPLIVDEITAGFRLNNGGAHLLFGLKPDIAVFGKGMSNGFPMAAIVGKRKVMEMAQDSFISSTYWTERIGPTAALATIEKMKTINIPGHLKRVGTKVQDGWKKAAKRRGIKIEVSGIFPLGHFEFKEKDPLVLKTLFTQLMMDKGFLATTAFYASFAHKDENVREYLSAVDEAFGSISGAIRGGSPEKHLKGPVCHSGFKRLT